jgi:hypothetical protein
MYPIKPYGLSIREMFADMVMINAIRMAKKAQRGAKR